MLFNTFYRVNGVGGRSVTLDHENNVSISTVIMNGVFSFGICLMLVLSPAVSASAQLIEVPLKDVLPVENIRLQGTQSNTDRYDYKVSIPKRWQVNHARFTFSYSCSTALIKASSRLIFSFAGQPIHQITLDPRSPKGEVSVEIPPKLLTPGYHAIRFEVAQHATENECEDPSAPELWTWVELGDAVMTFDVALRPIPEKISAVSGTLFDPKNPRPEPVNLVFPEGVDACMKPVSLCAAGVALRYDYRPVTFRSTGVIEPGMDTVWIGLDSDLRKQLKSLGTAETVEAVEAAEAVESVEGEWRVSGPYLEIRHLPLPLKRPTILEKSTVNLHGRGSITPDHGNNVSISTVKRVSKEPDLQGNMDGGTGMDGAVGMPQDEIDGPLQDETHSLILVTGRSWEEVERAAAAFSLISIPLPDTPGVTIRDLRLPDPERLTYENRLEPSKSYTLSSLGFNTHTFHGMNAIPKGFGFRIPSSSHLSPNSQAVLSLNIVYGAAMREDSVLNILLNDQFVGAIPCNDPEGGTYRNYEVRLLLSSMQPGYNKITFAPQMTPLVTDQCTMIQDGNLKMTLFDDARLTFPAIDQWIEMPQLRAFMVDAFPYGQYPDLRETSILILDKSRASLMTAINLLALTSQKIGYPPLGAKWEGTLSDSDVSDRDLICVSLSSTLPDAFLERAPLKLTSPGPLTYPELMRPKGYDPSKGKGIWSKLIPSSESRVIDLSLTDFELVVTQMDPVLLHQRGVMLQFESPFQSGRTVLILTAHSPEDMTRTAAALWSPSVQAACKGDTSLIDLSAKPFDTLSVRLGKSYYLGKTTPLPFVERYTNTYPIHFVALIFGLCILLALMAFWALKRRSRRRLDDASV